MKNSNFVAALVTATLVTAIFFGIKAFLERKLGIAGFFLCFSVIFPLMVLPLMYQVANEDLLKGL